MSDLEKFKESLALFTGGLPSNRYFPITVNNLRLEIEDIVDNLEREVNNIVGRRYSENDIIIEAKLNNMLVEARELYTTIIDLINK